MGKAFKVKFGGWRRGFFEGGEGCGFRWVFWRFDKRSKDGLVTALFKEPLRFWQWRWILRHFLQSVAGKREHSLAADPDDHQAILAECALTERV